MTNCSELEERSIDCLVVMQCLMDVSEMPTMSISSRNLDVNLNIRDGIETFDWRLLRGRR